MKRQLTSVDDRIECLSPAVPRNWQRLQRDYPDIVAAYDRLSEACCSAGPLEASVVALVKLAVSVGRGAERTVHAHTKKALRAGADPGALRQIPLLALPTVGLPAALDALRWVDESIREMKLNDSIREANPADAANPE